MDSNSNANANPPTPSVLRVAGAGRRADVPSKIEFDEYVPLRWRTYEQPLGGGLVRLGNFSTTLIELVVEPHSQIVRGATITSIDELSPWPEFSVPVTFDALPALSTSFAGWQVHDLKLEFEASVRPEELVVYWGELGACEAYTCGAVQLLVRDRFLCGAWFTGLSAEESNMFVSHARSRP